MTALTRMAAWATDGPALAAIHLAADGDMPRAGRIVEYVVSALLIAAVSATISAVISILILKSRFATLAARVKAHGEEIDDVDRRMVALAIACPEHRGKFVTKDEVVRVHAAISDVGRQVTDQLDELDRHSETRVGGVHERVNALQEQVGVLAGKIGGSITPQKEPD